MQTPEQVEMSFDYLMNTYEDIDLQELFASDSIYETLQDVFSSEPSDPPSTIKLDEEKVFSHTESDGVEKVNDVAEMEEVEGVGLEKILEMDTKSFNKLLKKFPMEKRNDLKRRRRQLKSRGYSKKFRHNSVSQQESLQREVALLKETLQREVCEKDALRKENQELRRSLNTCSCYQ